MVGLSPRAITHPDPSDPDEDPFVPGHGPTGSVDVVEPDDAWPEAYRRVATRIRAALGERVLGLEHVGSTSVPGLAAKPVIDIDLTVSDSSEEAEYVPALEQLGFVLVVRQPSWQQHRVLRHEDPRTHLHVFGPDAAEPVRHLLFREWLRAHPDDRERYAEAKRESSRVTAEMGGHTMDYNAVKEPVIQDIYERMFRAHGLLD